jgi:hypothetical protein
MRHLFFTACLYIGGQHRTHPGNGVKDAASRQRSTTVLRIHPVWDLFRSARNEFRQSCLLRLLVEENVMRIVALLILAAAFAAPASAEPTFLKREPLVLPPYVSVLVDTKTCGAGMVMRVRGAIAGRERQRTCVPMGPTQARNGDLL